LAQTIHEDGSAYSFNRLIVIDLPITRASHSMRIFNGAVLDSLDWLISPSLTSTTFAGNFCVA
jgi:hypothetical protein